MHEIALISDVHFGCRANSEKYLLIFEKFFKETLKNVIKERNIKDCRILGDLFDNRNSINIRTMNTVLSVFDMYEKEFPDLIISILLGNHDVYYHNRVDINSIECLRRFNNVRIISKVEKETISGKTILMVPWITSKTSEVYENFIFYANQNEKIDYVLGHFEIKNFEMIPGIKDENGFEHSIFNNFGRVVSGHFHLRNAQGKISYLGCPYQLSWSDYGDKKGIHILKVETNELEFIPNNDSPEHVKIYISDIAKFKDDIKQKKQILSQIHNNYIKFIIDKKFSDSSILKIINKLETLNPIKLEVENQYVDDISFDPNIENKIKDLKDPLSFLFEYCNNIEIQDVDKKDMLKRLSELYQLSIKEND